MRLLQKALTFDDVLLVPAYSEVLPRDTQLSTQLTRGLRINIPMVSAAMDTVTEANLAIALAQEGGIGFIHKNMTADQQAAEVSKVKRHAAGVVSEPIAIGPDMTIATVLFAVVISTSSASTAIPSCAPFWPRILFRINCRI